MNRLSWLVIGLARWPVPRWAVEQGCVGKDGFAKGFFQMQLLALGCLAERFDQDAGVGDDDELTLLRRGNDQPGEGW